MTTPLALISSIRRAHQVGVERLLVDRLHLARGEVLRQLRDPLELLVGVLVAGEDALEVQHRETAELADDRSPSSARRRRPSPRPAAAGRSGRARASRRCRRRRDRACAVRARSRCRRIHTRGGPSFRGRSQAPSGDPRLGGGRNDPAQAGPKRSTARRGGRQRPRSENSSATSAQTALTGRPRCLRAQSASVGGRDGLDVDLSQQPFDALLIDDARAEALGRLGAAGDAVAQALAGGEPS